MTEKNSRIRDPYLTCPECGGRCEVINSTRLLNTVREIRGRCQNKDCLKAGVWKLEFEKFVQPRMPKSHRFKVVDVEDNPIPRAA